MTIRTAARARARRSGLPLALSALTLVIFAAPISAEGWPQYRGPSWSGTVAAVDSIPAWEDGELEPIWRRSIGSSFSAVSIVGETAYTMAVVEGQDAVLALDAATGAERWKVPLGEPVTSEFGDGPRSTPTIYGGRVYTVSSKSRLVALDAADGRILWDRDLADWGPVPRFGYSVSPLVDGVQVIVSVGDRDKEPGLASFDRESGELRWSALDGPASYTSPFFADLAGVRQVIYGRGREVVSLSPDGEILWRHETEPRPAIPMPVFIPPDRFFLGSSDDEIGGILIRVNRDGDRWVSEEVWRQRLMRNDFNTSIEVGGFLYGFDNATLRCLDVATGERKWAHRGFGKGSLVAIGERILVLGDDGSLALVAADPSEYRELARTQAMTGKAWTAPSFADGRLFVRDLDEIAAFDLRTDAERSQGAAAIVARYREARGGAETWGAVETIEMTGVYAAFSERSPFRLRRKRGDLYRLDYSVLRVPAVRARDAEGAWGLNTLLWEEPTRIVEPPYRPVFEREAEFAPLLFDAEARGVEIAFAGSGEIDGVETIRLEVTRQGGDSEADGGMSKEIWHLDPETFLEVAVDRTTYDHTLTEEPLAERIFFSDFREVEGLVLPFRVEHEFGSRLESMKVEAVTLNRPFAAGELSPDL